jgi:hypothetical protein
MNAIRVTAAQSPYYAAGPGFYFCDCSGGSITFVLPVPASGQAAPCFVKRADVTYAPGNKVTVQAPTGYNLFDGTGATVLTELGQAGTFAADGISVDGAF